MEEPAAAVQIRPEYKGKIKPEDLQKYTRERVASFKVPVFIDIRYEAMVMGTTGKLLKREVKEEVMATLTKNGWFEKSGAKL